jgi:uncharacterized protein
MRMEGREESENVEDRRGMRFPGGGRGAGVGCFGLLAVLVIALLTGADPNKLLGLLGLVQQMTPPAVEQQVPAGQPPQDDPQARFVAQVLKGTEEAWGQVFAQGGNSYQKPTLVLFDGRVDSACGLSSAAVGPFYCPADRKVYLDLAFFRELAQRFGAPGDFAQAYVVAHEVGHHVQNLLGISEKVHSLRGRISDTEANKLSVMVELQADCLAGVWAHHADKARKILDQGDVEEALNAASAIGDDRLQRKSRGYVTLDSFTHGSSAQRMRWFKRGLETGSISQCNTFQTADRRH